MGRMPPKQPLTPPGIYQLMERTWSTLPRKRPGFRELRDRLLAMRGAMSVAPEGIFVLGEGGALVDPRRPSMEAERSIDGNNASNDDVASSNTTDNQAGGYETGIIVAGIDTNLKVTYRQGGGLQLDELAYVADSDNLHRGVELGVTDVGAMATQRHRLDAEGYVAESTVVGLSTISGYDSYSELDLLEARVGIAAMSHTSDSSTDNKRLAGGQAQYPRSEEDSSAGPDYNRLAGGQAQYVPDGQIRNGGATRGEATSAGLDYKMLAGGQAQYVPDGQIRSDEVPVGSAEPDYKRLAGGQAQYVPDARSGEANSAEPDYKRLAGCQAQYVPDGRSGEVNNAYVPPDTTNEGGRHLLDDMNCVRL